MKLKIALCLAGQPRNYNSYGYDTVKKYILESGHDVDVFFHTWWDESNIGEKYYSSPWAGQNISSNKECKSDLLKMYNPVSYKFEKSRVFTQKSNKLKCEDKKFWGNSGYCYWYSKREVTKLKEQYEWENNIKYDLCIMTRFDIVIGKFIPLEFFSPNVVNVLNIGRSDGLCTDVFVVTNSYIFNKIYLETFDDVEKYINNEKIHPMNEAILHHKITTLDMKINKERRIFIQIIRGLDKPKWVEDKSWTKNPDEFDINTNIK